MSSPSEVPISVMESSGVPVDIDSSSVLAKYGTTGFCPPPFHRLRFAFLGLVKCGKSVLVQSDPDSIIFSTENGCGFVDSKAIIVPDPTKHDVGLTMPMFRQVKEELKRLGLQHKHPRHRVVFDTFDAFVQLVDMELTEQENRNRARAHSPMPPLASITELPHGAGYAALAVAVFSHVVELELAGYGWTVLVHQRFKTYSVTKGGKTTEQSKLVAGLYPTTWDPIKKRADFGGVLTKGYREVCGKKLTPTGTEVSDLANKTWRPRVGLTWQAGAEDQTDEDCGQRLLLPDIPSGGLPEVGGMAVIEELYNKAVTNYRNNLNQLKGV